MYWPTISLFSPYFKDGNVIFWGLTATTEVLKETAELYKIKLPTKKLEVHDGTW